MERILSRAREPGPSTQSGGVWRRRWLAERRVLDCKPHSLGILRNLESGLKGQSLEARARLSYHLSAFPHLGRDRCLVARSRASLEWVPCRVDAWKPAGASEQSLVQGCFLPAHHPLLWAVTPRGTAGCWESHAGTCFLEMVFCPDLASLHRAWGCYSENTRWRAHPDLP